MRRYVRTGPRKPKKSKVLIFLDIVIGILAAFIIFGMIGFISSRKDNYYNRRFGDTSTDYDLQNGNYSGLLDAYFSDYGIIGLVSDGSEEAAAVAEYADAAFRRNAYLKDGDEESAARQKARMEEAAANVGIYGPEIAKIDKILGEPK